MLHTHTSPTHTACSCPRMTSRKRIAYFYDPDVGNFHYGKHGNRSMGPNTTVLECDRLNNFLTTVFSPLRIT